MVVTELQLAKEAIAEALEQWDRGEREKAAHAFLRQMAGPLRPYRFHDKWIAHLRTVAAQNNRELFEEALRSAAQHIILKD